MAGETLGEVIRRLDRSGGLQGDLAQTDAQLLERFARRRDEPAFAALMARHGPMVLGLCRRLLPDAPDAEDAFQATFLLLARKAGALPRQTLLGGWLYGVAWRVAVRLRGRAARRIRREQSGVDLDALPADDAAWSDVRWVVQEEVQRLPEKYRTVVILCCLEEKSNEEAAALLRRPVGTVKSRLARARDLLRSRLSRRGLAVSVGLPAALVVRPAQASAALVETALGAAPRFAAGDRLAGGAAARAAALARGVLRAAAVTKLTAAAGGVLAVCLLAGAIAWLAWPRPAGAGGQPDAQAIQGVWRVTAVDASGLNPPLDPGDVQMLQGMQWRFSADTMVMHNDGFEDQPIPYKLDPNSRPKAMDVTWPGAGTCISVYDLHGDELTIHLGDPSKQVRPDDLTPKTGDGTMSFTLRREK